MANFKKRRRGDWVVWMIFAIIVGIAIIALIYGSSIGFSAALLISVAALVISFFTTVLNATVLERSRLRNELLVNSEALRGALYNEMADIVHTFHQIFTADFLTRIRIMGTITERHTAEGDLILLKQLKMKVNRFMRLDVYDHTRSNPTLFYGFGDEARKIDWFYRMIKNGIYELDSQIQEVDRGLQPQETVYPSELNIFPDIFGWGDAALKDRQKKALDRTKFIETFEETYLKVAISYLDKDSLDYLNQFIDPDDQDYFARWREKSATASKLDNLHKETEEEVEVAEGKAESENATPTEIEKEIQKKKEA